MIRFDSISSRAGLLAVCLPLASCAAGVYRLPADFSPAAEDGRVMVIARAIDVTPATGYARTLKAGSKWRYIGRVAQGCVYAITDDVFMLEGKHMHEAHCVLADDATLVGFFLPAERAFAPLSPPVQLAVNFK